MLLRNTILQKLVMFAFFQVYATGTEDMDALTFGSTVLLRHLTFSEARSVSL